MGPILKDSEWVRQSFLIEDSAMEKVDFQNRSFTSASLKFTDTTPGGNFAINPPPQFTRYADPKVTGRFSSSKGMGRYYSEAIDDNSQIIHMRMGVPQFNSLTTFFTGFYNTGAGQLARTGRSTNAFYYLGRAAGFIVSIISWKLIALHFLAVVARFALQRPSSKFYYLKPTMPLYWNAVTTIVNQLAVNRGIVPRVGGRTLPGKTQGESEEQIEFDRAAMARLNTMLPDVFQVGGGVDVYALAGRAQRLARKHHKRMAKVMDSATNMNLQKRMDELSKKIQEVNSEKMTDQRPVFSTGDSSRPGYLERWLQTGAAAPKATAGDETDASSTTESLETKEPPGFFEFLQAELDDGSAFASFRVNSTGQVQESFSNTVMESELSTKINGMSSQSRSTNFSLAGGNLDGGIIGKTLGAVVTAAKDVAAGIMDSLSISGLAALGGSAFVDIPKHWHSSSAQLPRASYTVSLSSPYGNPVSQLTNIYIPLAMLLAAALPLSTGKQSYTSPFLLELFDQGRCQTRLGMIENLSVTRGTGNLGFNNEGHAMGIDVTFSIVDMSSILHMPISQGFSMGATEAGAIIGGVGGAVVGGLPGAAVGTVGGAAVGTAVDAAGNALKAAAGVFDEDTVFTDYMAVLSGMNLSDQIYSTRKLKLNLTRAMANWDSWYSTSHYASFAGDTMPARLVSAIFKGTAR